MASAITESELIHRLPELIGTEGPYDLAKIKFIHHLVQVIMNPNSNFSDYADGLKGLSLKDYSVKLPSLQIIEQLSCDLRIKEAVAKYLDRTIGYPEDIIFFEQRVDALCKSNMTSFTPRLLILFTKLLRLLRNPPIEEKLRKQKILISSVYDAGARAGKKVLMTFPEWLQSYVVIFIQVMTEVNIKIYNPDIELVSAFTWESIGEKIANFETEFISIGHSKLNEEWKNELKECIHLL